MINGVPPPPRSFAQRELEKVQRRITEGKNAEKRRQELITFLHREEGMSQVEIAARLSRASVAAGGPPIGDDAVFKIIKSARTNR